MSKRNWLIAIEGIDGVGKTTIADLLVQKLKAVYQKTPRPGLKWMARLIDKLHNPELESIGYLFLTILTSFSIQRLLKHHTVVCDKYILTTLVAQNCLGGKLVKLIEKFRYQWIKKPDYTFCLMIHNRAQLMERLGKRGKLDKNDKQLLPYWTQIQTKYQDFEEAIIIDTTDRNPNEVFDLIYQYLQP